MFGFKEGSHWIWLALIVLLLFGAKRLPDSARQLGRAMRSFKSEMKEMKNDDAPKSKDEGSEEK